MEMLKLCEELDKTILRVILQQFRVHFERTKTTTYRFRRSTYRTNGIHSKTKSKHC